MIAVLGSGMSWPVVASTPGPEKGVFARSGSMTPREQPGRPPGSVFVLVVVVVVPEDPVSADWLPQAASPRRARAKLEETRRIGGSFLEARSVGGTHRGEPQIVEAATEARGVEVIGAAHGVDVDAIARVRLPDHR